MSAAEISTADAAPRWWDSDLVYRFRRSPVAMLAAAVTLLLVALALGADIVAPFDAFDPASANIIEASWQALIDAVEYGLSVAH